MTMPVAPSGVERTGLAAGAEDVDGGDADGDLILSFRWKSGASQAGVE